jgi:inner membrane protein
MRRQTHLLLGAVAFGAYTYTLSLLLPLSSGTMFLGFFAALSGSVMPDVLEPPRDRTHRGFCHSRRAMRGAAELFAVTAILGLFRISDPSFSLSFFASGFFLGYAVHLLADSVTPAGLPG